MARRGDRPSRRELNEKSEKNREEMTEKGREIEMDASDVEVTRDTLANLEGGTSEGADAAETSLEGAEQTAESVFERDDNELEQAQEQNVEHEEFIEGRAEVSESDRDRVSEAENQIEAQETVSEVERAKEVVSNDIEILREIEERARQAREENEKFQQDQQARVRSGRRS